MSLLSTYRFKKRFVRIFENGDIQGGYCRMIISLIDFSFIRSLVADCYSPYGPPCYDPPSLFLLDLFRHIDSHQDMSHFLDVLRDKDRGRAYRTYAGISMDDIPCEGTFSNFRARLGETLYNEIFHVLVDTFHKLEMITFKILAHDGTLYPTWARYKGCTYFCDQCAAITVDNVINKVKNRILYRLNNLSTNNLGSEVRVYTQCPSTRFPEDVNKPKIELFAFRLAFADPAVVATLAESAGEPSEEQINTAILFDVKEDLDRQQLCINTIRSNVSLINFDDDTMTISCPKLPKDTDARIGVRRNPQDPNKKQKIFGYNLVLTTSVEVHLKIELPVAVTNIAGNATEGSQIINNDEQIYSHHQCQPIVDIADAKYDITNNYNYLRGKCSIPIIDYNPRNENLSKQAIINRGYDQNGWPLAPCGLLCRPNGFDKKHQRLTFCCFKQCLKLRPRAIGDLQNRYNIATCPYRQNQTGFAKHMYVKEHPRLVNEVPRGSKRYQNIKKTRSASERANSTLKEDLKIIDKPRVLNISRADILSQMAAIVLLLKRAFKFIVKITILSMKLQQTNDPNIKDKLKPPSLKQSIRSLLQLE